MAPKRKNAKDTAVSTVVSAIKESEALPTDVRTLLGTALPPALTTVKADRHEFEAEVVGQAQEALSIVGKARETAHAEALAKQESLVAPAERAARDAATKEAEAKKNDAQSKVEACDASKKEADKSVDDAETKLKVAQKEERSADTTLQKTMKKKAALEGALTNEFASLTASAKKSAKDAATRLLMSLGKEYGVGGTLLQAFALACKSEASGRSEFEATTLATVKAKLDEALQGVVTRVGEESAALEQKKADTAAAQAALTGAKAAQTEAAASAATAREDLKAAKKSYAQAVAARRNIWVEMRKICDAQDELAKAVSNFKDIMAAFEEAKEKVAPVVEEEPVEEPAEKKQRTEEAEPVEASGGNAD